MINKDDYETKVSVDTNMKLSKDNFYLKNIDLLRKLEPVMKKKGIICDGYVWKSDGAFMNAGEIVAVGCHEHALYTWIKPSLEAALPEWCFNGWTSRENILLRFAREDRIDVTLFYCEQFSILINKALKRGQESLEALAQLVILLDEEVQE